MKHKISNLKVYDKENYEFSLLENPEQTVVVPEKSLLVTLGHHSDEIWYVALSPDSKQLASVSKDKMVNVWKISCESSVLDISLQSHIKECHNNKHAEISTIQWHPESDKFLTACDNIKIFKSSTGECEKTIDVSSSFVSAANWIQGGKEIIFTEPEVGMKLVSYPDGLTLKNWTGFTHVCLTSQPDIDRMAFSSENQVGILSTSSKEKVKYLPIKKKIRAMKLSSDGQYLLVSKNQEDNEPKSIIELWDIENDSPIQKYSGHTQEKNVLAPSFGGKNEQYIVSGSEDDKIYIWARDSGELLETLTGHQNVANSVTWAKHLPNLIFSCSFDQTIKIWSTSSDFQVKVEEKYLFDEEEMDSAMEEEPDSDQSALDNVSEIDSDDVDEDMGE